MKKVEDIDAIIKKSLKDFALKDKKAMKQKATSYCQYILKPFLKKILSTNRRRITKLLMKFLL